MASPPRAQATVDLDAIAHNVRQLQRYAGEAEVMAVVKAGGYGHGLVESAEAARRGGARWLGVALLEEAVALRAAGDTGPILAWLPTPGADFQTCIELGIDISLAGHWMVAEVAQAARRAGATARVHLKADTGLGRSGVTPETWNPFVEQVMQQCADGVFEAVGIWSHLAYADSPHHSTIPRQIEAFECALSSARDLGLTPQYRHLANSAATLCLPQTHYDLVRPGIAVYGLSPGSEVGSEAELGLRPAMQLSARLVETKRLPAGHGVSYAHEYVTPRETTVGLVPLGYADGIFRSASGKGPVLAGGKPRTVAGRVCMDQFVVDLGDDDLKAGDEVIVFGDGSSGEPTVHDWAAASGTIAYEIVTTVGPRVPRVFVSRHG